jgi:hypothetical protein
MQTEAEMIERVRDEQCRECAALICCDCKAGHRAYAYAGQYYHVINGNEREPICQASAIRDGRPAAFSGAGEQA